LRKYTALTIQFQFITPTDLRVLMDEFLGRAPAAS
jgi:hypothetical protein